MKAKVYYNMNYKVCLVMRKKREKVDLLISFLRFMYICSCISSLCHFIPLSVGFVDYHYHHPQSHLRTLYFVQISSKAKSCFSSIRLLVLSSQHFTGAPWVV